MFPVVADEDIDRPIIEKLRYRDIEVFSIDEELKGATDSEVLDKAKNLDYPILTFDEEFAKEYGNEHEFLYVTGPAPDDAVVDAVCEVMEDLERANVSGLVYISPG